MTYMLHAVREKFAGYIRPVKPDNAREMANSTQEQQTNDVAQQVLKDNASISPAAMDLDLNEQHTVTPVPSPTSESGEFHATIEPIEKNATPVTTAPQQKKHWTLTLLSTNRLAVAALAIGASVITLYAMEQLWGVSLLEGLWGSRNTVNDTTSEQLAAETAAAARVISEASTAAYNLACESSMAAYNLACESSVAAYNLASEISTAAYNNLISEIDTAACNNLVAETSTAQMLSEASIAVVQFAEDVANTAITTT